jgi:hypothetical protein
MTDRMGDTAHSLIRKRSPSALSKRRRFGFGILLVFYKG